MPLLLMILSAILVFSLIIGGIIGWVKLMAILERKNQRTLTEIQEQLGKKGMLPRTYIKKKSILSQAELRFHRVLSSSVPEAPILPKMRVADVIDTAPQAHITAFRKIAQKHFDWVICHPITLEPLLAIELDDSSHRTSRKQIENDAVKNQVANEAGLELLRVNWERDYDEEKIRDQIAVLINKIADQKEARV